MEKPVLLERLVQQPINRGFATLHTRLHVFLLSQILIHPVKLTHGKTSASNARQLMDMDRKISCNSSAQKGGAGLQLYQLEKHIRTLFTVELG